MDEIFYWMNCIFGLDLDKLLKVKQSSSGGGGRGGKQVQRRLKTVWKAVKLQKTEIPGCNRQIINRRKESLITGRLRPCEREEDHYHL